MIFFLFSLPFLYCDFWAGFSIGIDWWAILGAYFGVRNIKYIFLYYIVSSNIIFLGILRTEIRHKVLLLLNDRDRICWTWLTTRGRGWVWKYRPTLYGVTTITVREIMQWKNPLNRDKFKGSMKKVMFFYRLMIMRSS